MSDYLVGLSQKKWFRKSVSTLGLPLPMPQALERAEGPWVAAPLTGRRVLLNDDAAAELGKIVADAGGTTVADDDTAVDALLFDARKITTVEGLHDLYAFVHGRIRAVNKCGRVLVVARRPEDAENNEAAAAANATLGFVKSVAKEVGRKGATANVIFVGADSDNQLPGPVRFLLSPRAAYVDGQPLTLTETGKAPAKSVWVRPLDGHVAVVTGAARGIGAEVARRLAEEGAEVLVADLPSSREELEQTAERIGGHPLELDVAADDAANQIRKAAEPLGELKVVVNNAGVTRDRTLAKMTDDEWNLALRVNLAAAMRISSELVQPMGQNGRSICLSSIAGIAGNFGQTNYASAKSGLIGLVRSMASDFRDAGGTINAIAPGFIETRMTAAVPFMTREAGRRMSNLGQGGEPVDVAEAITFLASPGAAGINGQVLRVCGGNYLGA